MGLVDTDGFDAGKAWCEEHAEAIGGASAYAFSKQVVNVGGVEGGRLPGQGRAPQLHQSRPDRDADDAVLPPVLRQGDHRCRRRPRPILDPEEQAWALVFLNSPRLSCVTGEALYADGGFFGALQTGQVDFSNVTAAG